MTIAILAHDSRKELALQFCTAYSAILSKNVVIATGTTGRMLAQMGKDWNLTGQVLVEIGSGPAGSKFYTHGKVWKGADALRQPGVVLKGHAV